MFFFFLLKIARVILHSFFAAYLTNFYCKIKGVIFCIGFTCISLINSCQNQKNKKAGDLKKSVLNALKNLQVDSS